MKTRTRIFSFFKSFLMVLLLSSAFLFAATPTAADTLKVTNKDGVMYVTTEALAQTTVTGTPSPTPSPAAPVIEGEIKPGKGFATDVATLINFALRLVMVIAVLLVFFFLIVAGIEWIMSGGEKGKTEAARNKIMAAVIGLVILAGSYAILMILIRMLGFTDLPSVFNSVGTIDNPGATPIPNISPTPTPSPTPDVTPTLRELIP